MISVKQRASNVVLQINTTDDVSYLGIEHIIEVYRMATKDEQVFDWYAEAKSVARKLSKQYNIDLHTVAKVIATLSPMQKWETNVKQAEQALKNWVNNDRKKVGMFSANSEKVYSILDGTGDVTGIKVTNFYKNIVGFTDCVTVDSLATLIAIGLYDHPCNAKVKDPVYDYLEGLYKLAAKALDIPPSQLQAITWVVSRRTKKSNHGNKAILTAFDVGLSLKQLVEKVKKAENETD